jgi:3-oxoacyl-[acyl-carrier protein] reductase
VTQQPLQDQVALVVGGGTGIGRAIALALAEAGASVAVAGRRPDPLQEVAGRIAADGGRSLAVPADVLEPARRAGIVAAVERGLGPVDVLVMSTARPPSDETSWLEWTDEHWRAEVEVAALAGFALTQLIAPGMARRRRGRIVFIGSVLGGLGVDPSLYRSEAAPEGVSAIPYHAAKGATIATARALACLVARDGVTVNVVSPGMIDTEGVSSLMPAEVRARMERLTPAGRLGAPADVAAAVLFLASAGAGFVTGHELVVDGGWSAW